MLETILQLLITGVALGFVYALVGVEYTLVWQSSGLLNVAHNMLITTAAFVFGGTFVVGLGWPIWLSILCTLLVMFVLGCLISATIFNPLRNMPLTMYSIVGTQIFAKVISEALRLIYGPYSFTIPGFLTGVIKIGDFVFAKAYGYIIVVAILLIIALQMFLKLTKPGKAMRCVAQNKTAAAIMGIDIDRSINITTGLSCVICGIIGVLTIPLFTISLTMSNMIGLKGWAAGIVGGFGYIPGTILGGLLIGVVEALAILVIPTVYKDIVAFVFLDRRAADPSGRLHAPQSLMGKGNGNETQKISVTSLILPVIMLVVAVVLPMIYSTNYYIQLFQPDAHQPRRRSRPERGHGSGGPDEPRHHRPRSPSAPTSALISQATGSTNLIGLLAALVVAVLVGFMLGYPSLRVSGIFLSLTTMSVAQIVYCWPTACSG